MSLIKLNNNAVKNIDSVGSVSTGDMVFIKKLTASSSATLSFVDGSDGVVLDDTYKEYLFTFKNIHLASNTPFSFQGSTDSGSSYGVTITSTSFFARHIESDITTGLSYSGVNDLAQSTSFQRLATDQGTNNDENMGGTLQLFAPSSTTFVKHFISNCQAAQASNYSMQRFVAGYFNSTSAINSIQFKAETGNIDAGDICLYGIA